MCIAECVERGEGRKEEEGGIYTLVYCMYVEDTNAAKLAFSDTHYRIHVIIAILFTVVIITTRHSLGRLSVDDDNDDLHHHHL